MDDLLLLPRWHWTEMSTSETNRRIWWRIGLMLVLVLGLGAIGIARSIRGPII